MFIYVHAYEVIAAKSNYGHAGKHMMCHMVPNTTTRITVSMSKIEKYLYNW